MSATRGANSTDYGAFLMPLLLTMPEWVMRRVEQLDVVDDDSVRVRVSTDFDLRKVDDGGYVDLLEDGFLSQSLLPLGFFAKRDLVALDVRDQDGRALSLLTREEYLPLMVAILVERAAVLVGRAELDMVRELLEEIVKLPAAEGRMLVGGLPGTAPSQAAASVMTGLLADPPFRYLAETFSEKFLFIVDVGEKALETRGIVKYSYITRLSLPRDFVLLSRLALRPTRAVLDVPLARLSGSYHVEVAAPESLEIHDIRLTRRVPGNEPEVVARKTGKRQRGHLNLSGRRFYDNASYSLTFDLAPQQRGLLRTGVLTVLVALIGQVFLLTYGKRLHGEMSPDSAAFLLIIPGLLAAYISRPAEHPITSRIFLGVRLAMSFAGGLSLASAAFLAVESSVTTLRIVAVIGCAGTGSVLAVLISAYFLCSGLMVNWLNRPA